MIVSNVVNNKDLVPQIFYHLGAKDLVICARVCKLWNETVYKLEHTWKSFCEECSLGPMIPGSSWKDTFNRLFTIINGEPFCEYKELNKCIGYSPVFYKNLVAYYNEIKKCIQIVNLTDKSEVENYSLNSVDMLPRRIEIDDFNLIVFDAPFLGAIKIHVLDRFGSTPAFTKVLNGGAFFSNRHLISQLLEVGAEEAWGTNYTVWNLDQTPMEVQYNGKATLFFREFIFKMFFYRDNGADCLVTVTAQHFFQILDLSKSNYLYSQGGQVQGGWADSTLHGSYLTSLYRVGHEHAVLCWNLDQHLLYNSFKIPTNKRSPYVPPYEFSMFHSVENDLFFYHISETVLVYRMQTGVKLHEIKSAIFNPIGTAIYFFNDSIFLQKSDSESEVYRFFPKTMIATLPLSAD